MTHEQQPAAEEPSANSDASQPEQAGRTDHAERPEFARPEIWVGSLSDYNNGDLYGIWMAAARRGDEIHADIQSMLARGPAAGRGEAPEEWGIFDHEGFGSLQIGEYESIEDVSRIARAVAEYGPAFTAYAELVGSPLSEITSEGFREAYLVRFDSVVAYAQELTSELGYEEMLDELPAHVRPYVRVDYEQFAHDLQVGGDISYSFSGDGGVHIFRAE